MSGPARRTPKCTRWPRPARAPRGATLYCTLEPCCHQGRTGPCVSRIVEAGIARVVAAVEDPNPARARPRLRVSPRARRGGGRRPRRRARRHAEPAVLHADARRAAVRGPQGGDQPRRPHRRGARPAHDADVGGGEPPRAPRARGSGRDRRRRRHDPGRRSRADGARRVPRAAARPRHLRPPPADAAGGARALDTRRRACHHRDDGRVGGARRPARGRSKRAARRSRSPPTARCAPRWSDSPRGRSNRCCSKAARAVHAAAWDEGLVDFVRLYVTPHVLGAERRAAAAGPRVFVGGAARAAGRAARTRRPDRGICSRASLKPSANWSSARRRSGGFRLRIATPLAPELTPGDSLAVNGVCLTVILAERGEVHADVGPETVRVTTLGSLARGSAREPRASAARRPAGSAATSCRGTSTRSGTSRSCGRKPSFTG